jgi:cytochrome c-type biogenesis protein CcmH
MTRIGALLASLLLGSAMPLGSAPAFADLQALAEPAQTPAPVSAAASSPAASSPAALDDHAQLRDPVLQTRFERITKELRCLVCQNESIADSNVDLAADLRRQVREMLVAGRSDDAIFNFMTDRYGEFVRFAPPLTAKTALIWGAPFFMLLLGGLIIYRVVRQRSRMPLDE